MIRKVKCLAATVLAVGALSAATAGPASAAPVVTGGFVNITVTDVLNNDTVNVQVPIGVAANVCGVSVAVIGAAVLARSTAPRPRRRICRSASGRSRPIDVPGRGEPA